MLNYNKYMFNNEESTNLTKYDTNRVHYKNTIFIYTALLGEYSYRTKNVYISEANPYFLLFSGYFMYLLSL